MGSVSLRSVLAIALVLRAAAACVHAAQGPGPSALFDERPFLLVARSLAEDGRFATRPGGPPDVIRGPAYPAFLLEMSDTSRRHAYARAGTRAHTL